VRPVVDHIAADLAGESGSVAVGPRKAAVLQGQVEAAEGHLEAQALLAAEQRAPRLCMQQTDPFVTSRSGNALVRRCAPAETGAVTSPALRAVRNYPNPPVGLRQPAKG